MPNHVDTTELAAKAATFLDLHHRYRTSGKPVILPTVWDAWSARAAELAGFAGLTIGSHPLADALGYEDGENTPVDEIIAAAWRITSSVDIPVSLDFESGFSLTGAEIVDAIIAAGAVGLNLEDSLPKADRALKPADEHAALIESVNAAASARGVPLVINGRTDAFLRPEKVSGDNVAVGIERLLAYQAAGAQSLYPVGFFGVDVRSRILEAVELPVNITAEPAQAPADLSGVARVSFGPLLQKSLGEALASTLSVWVDQT